MVFYFGGDGGQTYVTLSNCDESNEKFTDVKCELLDFQLCWDDYSGGKQ